MYGCAKNEGNMNKSYGCQSMVAPLRRVIVKRPQEAFRSEQQIASQWKDLVYTAPPDLTRACDEHERFVSLLREAGAEVLSLPEDDRAGLDSIYTHDPGIVTDAGAVVFQTGKVGRRGEGPALADALRTWDVPVIGVVEGDATAEGGDLIWLDQHTLLAGRGFRTNAAGIASLRKLLEPLSVRVIEVPLPYWTGPQDCLHLMSFISLLDVNLAVVYSKLLPVPMYELLMERSMRLVEVPDEEYGTQGCNVLTLAPRNAVLLAGNPVTRRRLETAGCRVHEFSGEEISFKGSGGPTCLTRPLLRG
jgi:N-dimethylarginine dimethylaminohydrolase